MEGALEPYTKPSLTDTATYRKAKMVLLSSNENRLHLSSTILSDRFRYMFEVDLHPTDQREWTKGSQSGDTTGFRNAGLILLPISPY